MWKLQGPVMPYAWGSPTAIPEFFGKPAAGEPIAEVWYGAHAKGPATVLGIGGSDVPLDRVLRSRPYLLGDRVLAEHGPRLPFMVKLLAAARPLSLQVHPDQGTASAGFEREEAGGLPLEAASRTFRDPFHKPEVMLALGQMETLAGFRAVEEAERLLSALSLPWADRVADLLMDGDVGPAFQTLIDQDAWDAAAGEVLARCGELASRDRAYHLVGHLHSHHPGDSGVVAPLMLNVVRYGPGEALFVPTGQIHAHVQGFGVEVMAASDNVIRAGLTSKKVDKEALFETMTAHPQEPQLRRVTRDALELEVGEFSIEEWLPGDSLQRWGPSILLALEHATFINGMPLGRGEAVLMADGEELEVELGRVLGVHVPQG